VRGVNSGTYTLTPTLSLSAFAAVAASAKQAKAEGVIGQSPEGDSGEPPDLLFQEVDSAREATARGGANGRSKPQGRGTPALTGCLRPI
jgi:hypothetical protein